jgi:hypothetical protein
VYSTYRRVCFPRNLWAQKNRALFFIPKKKFQKTAFQNWPTLSRPEENFFRSPETVFVQEQRAQENIQAYSTKKNFSKSEHVEQSFWLFR